TVPPPAVEPAAPPEPLPPAPGTAVPGTREDPSWGEALAPGTLVEWGGFQDPFTGRVVPTINELERLSRPAQLPPDWKNNPLPFHQHARSAAVAAYTVFKLGGSKAFWAFHARAFKNQREVTPENFERWAVEAGVEAQAFRSAYESSTHADNVEVDIKVG